MSHYLIVAHQTAEAPEVLDRVRALAHEDREAEFTLLVPATAVQHLLTWSEGESRALAAEKAERAGRALAAAGANVTRTVVGDGSPLAAVRDELAHHPDHYDAIIICTFPSSISRWLKLDIVSQVRRASGLPVIHVQAEPARAAAPSH